jgi:hypothetical protein
MNASEFAGGPWSSVFAGALGRNFDPQMTQMNTDEEMHLCSSVSSVDNSGQSLWPERRSVLLAEALDS